MSVFSVFVESLKRLYADGKVRKEKIEELCNRQKITKVEMEYILDVKISDVNNC